MTDPVRKSASGANDDAVLSEASGSVPDKIAAGKIGADFPEAATETIAALLHLVKLMGGELVLNVGSGETEPFERAVRAKIAQYTSPTNNPAARKSGLAFASHLVEQVLVQLRALAEVKRSLAKRKTPQPQEMQAETSITIQNSKLLN